MTAAQLRANFDENSSGLLSAAERDRLAVEIDDMESLDDVSTIVGLSIPTIRRAPL